MRVRIAVRVSVRVALLAALLACATLDRAVADTLETWDDLDVLVTNVFATMGFASGISTLPPPAPMRVWQGLAPVPFDPAGLTGLTNGVSPVPLVGIDTWGVDVVETQLSTRVWICFGADGMPLRTNNAAELCDPEAWLTARYGQPPSWLGGVELADWIADRERARVSLRLRLVPVEHFAALCDLLAAYATNAIPAQANDPVAPVDTNRLAFAGLLPRADETHLRFWLYAPQDHLPVDLFGSATRAPPSDWFHVGQLDATTPFTSWEMPDLGLSGFFLAARSDTDTDGDRLPDAREWLLYGTDSTLADSDGDGLDDGNEVEQTDTDPGSPDSDGDGLDDGDEVEQTGTDPGSPDSDGDGMWDFAEIATGTSPSDSADALETDSAVTFDLSWPAAQGGAHFIYRASGIDATRWVNGNSTSGWLPLAGDYDSSPAGRLRLCLVPGQTVMLGVWVEGDNEYTGAPDDATLVLTPFGPAAGLCIQDGEPIGIVAPSNVELYTFYCILQADLDIDSDDSAGLGTPEGTAAEDRIEDDPALPGKVIVANDDDSDDDGVSDFADGYNRDGNVGNVDDASTNDCFVPLVLRIPALPGSIGPASLRLSYSASDPAAVTNSGTPPQPSPAPGHLRIWTRNADQPRNPAACAAEIPGDYVPPGTYADLTALGFVDGPGTVTLYVEGIAPSALAGDQRITVELDPDGPGEVHGWLATDAVRVSVLKVDLDIDSGNLASTNLPPRTSEADAIETSGGSTNFPGKIVYMNDMDVDGDQIPDFLDGFGCIDPDDVQNGEDLRVTGGAFIPIVLDCSLPAGIDPANARIEFVYDDNDPGAIGQMTLAASTEYATNAWQQNTLSGRIRIWTKDASENRDPASVASGGDFVPPDTLLPYQDVATDAGTQIVFYVEGVGTSPTWGGDKIKVRVYPYGAGQPWIEDQVSYTVVRCVYKVCVYRPYVCLRDASGTITNRQVFRTDYSSPSNMLACYFTGMAQFDDHDKFHTTAAAMGHAFARLEVRSPDYSVGESRWTGQTGMNDKENYEQSYSELKAGRLWWFRATDGEEDKPETAESRYTQLYVTPVPDSYLSEPNDGTARKMLAIREFRLRPEVSASLLHYRGIHPFGGYGLDTVLRTGTNSCAGCGSYVGLLTDYAGVADTSSWVFDRYMPEVPLPNIWITMFGTGGAYAMYELGAGAWLRAVLLSIQADAMPSVAATPGITAWGDENTGRSLRFCDPGWMMGWVDQENQTTPWEKDRGVTVRHDLPPTSDLSSWRNR